MQSQIPQLPYWLQVSQALAVPIIAVAGAVIAAAQWYTAHRKTVMDLFDRRLEIYNAVRDVIGEVSRHGTSDDKLFFEYLRAIDRAPFLFGGRVNKYLERLRKELSNLALAESMMKAKENAPEYSAWVDKKYRAFEKITAFYTEFPPIIAPYIVLDQKIYRLRQPQWLKENPIKKKPQP